MSSLIACCRDALTVAGWLAAWMPAAGPTVVQPARDGPPEIVWRVQGEARGTPALVGHTAFFLSRHHELVAIDVRSGQVNWRRETRGPGATTAGTSVVATPTTVIAGDGGLVAFTHAGAERWRFASEDGGNAGVYLGERAGSLLLAGSAAGRLWALDADSGVVRWSLGVGNRRHATVFAPVVADGVVLAAFTSFDDLRVGGLVAVELATGRQLWHRPLAFAGGPLVAGSLVLAAQQDGSIHAFDRRSGTARWSLPPATPSAWDGPEFRTLALAGPLLIAGSLTGRVTAYDLATRQERWRRAPLSASIVFGIASDERTVYVPYLSGPLVALGAENGAERWRTGADTSGFSWKPLIVAGHLLAASSGAGFFAFRL